MENKVERKSKDLIFSEGEEAKSLFLIDSGEVICLKASKDRLIPIFLAKAGDIIGENAMVSGSIYSYSAIATKPTVMLPISSTNIKNVLGKGPNWLTELSSIMINRFQSTANLIAENRVIHNSILPEEEFTSALEVEYKKIIKL